MDKNVNIKALKQEYTTNLIEKIMIMLQKPFLTPQRFDKNIKKAESILFDELKNCKDEDLLGLFLQYLRANGFEINRFRKYKGVKEIDISKKVIVGKYSKGIALLIDSTFSMEIISAQKDKHQLKLIYLPENTNSITADKLEEIGWIVVTNNELMKFLLVLLLERYTDEYFMTITTMPGMKEKVISYMEGHDIRLSSFEK